MPSDEILVGADGTISVGPTTATMPTDPVAALVGFTDLGHADENGITVTDTKTITDIPVWQLFYPARKIISSRAFSIQVNLRNWNGDTIKLAFGGGTITGTKYTPPAPSFIDERAMVVSWQDGTKNYRLVVPRGLVSNNVASKLTRTAAADLPITFDVIGTDGVDPWFLLTDDPAFAS